jgi:predicted N-acyltransferase
VSGVRLVSSIAEVTAAAWDALDHGGSPFLRHGFLRALEETRSIGKASGWEPHYLLIERGGTLNAAMAAFVKRHSYGEFIFDWEWARASERARIRYYPKLVVAAPMTPATGPRLLLDPALDPEARRAAAAELVAAARRLASDKGCSGLHFLFVTREERDLLAELGVSPRASFQFHWQNRGYADFADFLSRMSSRRRKQARKERERARAAVDAIDWLKGESLGAADLAAMDRFYRDNVDAHYGTAYLEPGTFELLARYLPDNLVMARACRGGDIVAGALYLETDRGLYGRYWGCDESIPNLHFEMTVWGPIERAIQRGQAIYEAGAQGSHKLLRGLEPNPTHSCHQLFHPALAEAIGQFLCEEERAVHHHMARLAAAGPFKDDP